MNSPCLNFVGTCLTRAPVEVGESLFGFPDFLTGLALLALVFTQSDPLYRFRIAVAPIPVGGITLTAILLVGAASLVTDLWFSLGWYSLAWGVPKAVIQAILGTLVFLTVLLWLTFAFALPPRFGPLNARKFTQAVFRALAFGGEGIMPVIALEIRRSAETIIAACKPILVSPASAPAKTAPDQATYAFDLLRLIANRRFCRHIVANSPGTAIVLMTEAARQSVFSAPLGAFAQNITLEALKNHDSGLFHEDRYSTSGLLGEMQPFTRAMYGCYDLVEKSSTPLASALDLHYRETDELTADEWEAFGRALTKTTASYVSIKRNAYDSTVLNRAIEQLVGSTSGLYEVDGIADWRQTRGEIAKLRSAMRVVSEIVEQIDTSPNQPTRRYALTGRRKYFQRDFTDDLCEALLEMLFNASAVAGPVDTAWSIQHNIFWRNIGRFAGDSQTWKVVRARLTRLIIHELKDVREFADFRSIRILGLLLNVLGVREHPKSDLNSEFAFLRRYTIALVKTTYMKIVAEQPHVAEALLLGGITFNPSEKRLVKTYARGLEVEPARAYLDLDDWVPPTSPAKQTRTRSPKAKKGGPQAKSAPR